MQRSSRDPERVRPMLEAWLAARLPAGAAPVVPAIEGTSTNGMSSETLLFDAEWTEDGEARRHRLVARVAPDAADVPVFPTYDLQRQFDVIRLVGQHTVVPVPTVRWSEPDASVIGAPFFVMDRVDGDVPPDVMPYTFGDNWLYDASPTDQRRLQGATVAVLAELHSVTGPEDRFGFLTFAEPGATPLRRHVAHTRAWYEFVVADGGRRSPLVEGAFDWIDDHWPADEGPTVVSWGDSRIGNVMYHDFEPVAVLDWEMAGLGPPELDLAWLLYGHCVFQDIAATYGLEGMPAFLRADDVAATYESHTGHALRYLDWYGTYAAVQWAIVFLRTAQRAVRFGEQEAPADVDEQVMNREPLERMLAGTYWSEGGWPG